MSMSYSIKVFSIKVFSIKVFSIDTVFYSDCTLSDEEYIYQDIAKLLESECLDNKEIGLGYHGVVRYTLKGLIAYYHINSLAKNLCNTSKSGKPGNVEKSLMLMRMCKEYEKALIKSKNMCDLFAAFDDGVKTLLIQRVLDAVKMSNVALGLRTGLCAAKELVDSGVVGENIQAFSAESFEDAAKELDEFIQLVVEAGMEGVLHIRSTL